MGTLLVGFVGSLPCGRWEGEGATLRLGRGALRYEDRLQGRERRARGGTLLVGCWLVIVYVGWTRRVAMRVGGIHAGTPAASGPAQLRGHYKGPLPSHWDLRVGEGRRWGSYLPVVLEGSWWTRGTLVAVYRGELTAGPLPS